MAYLQSRSNIARSGVTYCGWTPPNVKAYLGGVDRTASLLRDGEWVITQSIGQPWTFAFTTKSITPVEGNDVKVVYATPDEYLFAGTLLQIEATPIAPGSSFLQWHCMATGYHWLADRYDLPLARYRNLGVNTMVAALLANFTNGGFVPGYIPSSLGNQDLDLSLDATVMEAIDSLGGAVSAIVEMTPDRHVNVYATPLITWPTLTEAKVLKGSLRYQRDLTQVRTRTLVHGRGSTLTASVVAGASTIPVTDTGPFSVAGGTAIAGPNRITYASKSVESGAGTLTGVTGVTWDLSENDEIRIEAAGTSGTAALAAVLGGGLSGQATHRIDAGGASATACASGVIADLAVFSTALPALSFTYKTVQRHLRPGILLPVSITDPLAISGDFLVQSVTTTIRGAMGGTNAEVFQTVTASRFTRILADLLRQLDK